MSVSLDFPAVLCTGVDPLVMGRSQDPLQRYFAHMTVALEEAVLLLIVLHAMGLERVWGFQRLAPLDRPWIDETGLVLGLLGLALCRAAQATMGNSWRVGIDETRPTRLIETGVFRYIRNPTYTGLFTIILGLWIIWPTAFITLFGVCTSPGVPVSHDLPDILAPSGIEDAPVAVSRRDEVGRVGGYLPERMVSICTAGSRLSWVSTWE
jgi:protein-S-isoprenylcysteine O-methyltransferase Ste14